MLKFGEICGQMGRDLEIERDGKRWGEIERDGETWGEMGRDRDG